MREQPELEAIQAYVERQDSSSQAHAQYFHQLERWRDRLLTGSAEEQEAFIAAYPDADRQTIRQLVRQAQKEAAENKPPAASRKLFKLIRQVAENADWDSSRASAHRMPVRQCAWQTRPAVPDSVG